MPIQIEPVTKEDIEDVVELWLKSFDFHHGFAPEYYLPRSESLAIHLSDYVKRCLHDSKESLFVGKLHAEIVGFILLEVSEDHYFDTHFSKVGLISEVYVRTESQRMGFARALMAHAEAYLKEKGVDCIQLMVHGRNAGALKFYQSLSYSPAQVQLMKTIE